MRDERMEGWGERWRDERTGVRMWRRDERWRDGGMRDERMDGWGERWKYGGMRDGGREGWRDG